MMTDAMELTVTPHREKIAKAMLRYCFLSSMLPFTLLALMSRPPFPILPDA